MTVKTLLGAVALALTTAAPVAAAPIYLDFAFDGVSGTFYGLDDSLLGAQAATSFDLFGELDVYTVEVRPTALNNSFIFSPGGTLTDVLLFSGVTPPPGSSNPSGAIFVRLTHPSGFGELFELRSDSSEVRSFGDITFTTRPVAAVPLPAGAVLLLSGLVGVAGLKRRKKHAA